MANVQDSAQNPHGDNVLDGKRAKATTRFMKGSGQFLYQLAQDRLAALGLLILVGWLVAAIAWPALTPFGPNEMDLGSKFQSPSFTHWFGTDSFGRDVFTRVLAGSRSVLLVAVLATVLGIAVGTTIGLVAGFFRGWIGETWMRLMDVLLSFPLIVIALLVLAAVGPSQLNVILVLAFGFVPYNARVMRSATLQEADREFVIAARLRGESSLYITFVEILPNLLGVLVVEFTIRLALAIFSVATLSFLGLGLQPPAPDWGLMIAEGRQFYRLAPWVVLFPSLAIASVVVGLNFVAERLNAR